MTDIARRLLRRAQPQLPLPVHKDLSPRAGGDVATPLAFLEEPAGDDTSLAAPPTPGFAASAPAVVHRETLVERRLAAEPSMARFDRSPGPLPTATPSSSSRPGLDDAPVTITRVLAERAPSRISPASQEAPHSAAPGSSPQPEPAPIASLQPAQAAKREPSPHRATTSLTAAPDRGESAREPVTDRPRSPERAPMNRDTSSPAPLAPPAPAPAPPRAVHHLDPQRPGPPPLPSLEPSGPRVVIDNLHIELVREAPRAAAPPPQRRDPSREAPSRTATTSRVRPRLAFGMRQL